MFDRRILSPIAVTVVAGALVGVATLGGSIAGDRELGIKTDRFAVIGDELCEGQVWPNLSPECLSWSEGEALPDRVRFVTVSEHNHDVGLTTLTRVREIASY